MLSSEEKRDRRKEVNDRRSKNNFAQAWWHVATKEASKVRGPLKEDYLSASLLALANISVRKDLDFDRVGGLVRVSCRGMVLNFINRESTLIKVPRKVRNNFLRIKGVAGTDEEISLKLGIPLSDIFDAREILKSSPLPLIECKTDEI